jgi:hypothetical protein
LHKITGAIGDVKIKASAGQYATLEFTMRGNYNAIADVALPSSATYEATTPPVVESAQLTINSINSLVVQEVNISMDNSISERDDVNSPNGLKGFEITAREPKGSFNPEATLVGTYNPFLDWVNSAQRALSMVVGATSGNKIEITAPKVVIESVADGDRNGVLTRDIPFRLGQNAGNDEIQIKFF